MTAHRITVRVYYEDTDMGGIVYYANYLKFFERGRTELLRSAGIENSKLLTDDGVAFVVSECQIRFLKGAVMDDLLDVETIVNEIKGVRIFMKQTIFRQNLPLVSMTVTLACMDRDGRAVRIPDSVSGKLIS